MFVSDVTIVLHEPEKPVVLPDMPELKKMLQFAFIQKRFVLISTRGTSSTSSTKPSRGYIETLMENISVQVTNIKLEASFLRNPECSCTILVDSFSVFSTNSQCKAHLHDHSFYLFLPRL